MLAGEGGIHCAARAEYAAAQRILELLVLSGPRNASWQCGLDACMAKAGVGLSLQAGGPRSR
jgi:hypothetical protein